VIWLLGTLVALLAVVGLATPWWWAAFAQRDGVARRAANVAAYRGRLRELDADAAAGVVPAEGVESARDELASRLLQDVKAPPVPDLATRPSRAILVLAGVALVAFTGIWYAAAGTWRTQALVELARHDPDLARAAALDQSIARLREQVASNPGDADSWAWLGRSYRTRGNYGDAAAAFAKASALKGGLDPDLLTEEGEALAYGQDRAMAGEPATRFSQALALAPDHPQALWYAGIAALQAGDDRGAIAHWEHLSRLPLPDDTRRVLEHSLEQLRARAGVVAPAAGTAPAAAVALNIAVEVAPSLVAEMRPDDALFVYAVDASGPPMPLAVERLSAGALPLQITLDDGDSMMPQRKLSSVQRWRVIARVSRSGSATPQPGDLQGEVELSHQDAGKPIAIVIDQRRP
jgi:cytochrome c-type biogenesis protein CcmH